MKTRIVTKPVINPTSGFESEFRLMPNGKVARAVINEIRCRPRSGSIRVSAFREEFAPNDLTTPDKTIDCSYIVQDTAEVTEYDIDARGQIIPSSGKIVINESKRFTEHVTIKFSDNPMFDDTNSLFSLLTREKALQVTELVDCPIFTPTNE